MSTYQVVVLGEEHDPLFGVVVEAVSLNNFPTVTATASTGNNGAAVFTGIEGPHLFRPLTRRVSGGPGKYNFTGSVEVEVVVSGGEGMNVDYVVDSNGMGTHTKLFTSTGALEAAIATGGNRTIWVCTTHVETLATTHTLTELAANQRIVVLSAGRNRPTFTVVSGLGTTAAIKLSGVSSGANTQLRFEGLAFNRPTSIGAGDFFEASSGAATPTHLDFIDLTFSGNDWVDLISVPAPSAGTYRNILFEKIVSIGSLRAIMSLSTSAAVTGYLIIKDCDFNTLENIIQRINSSDVDPGIDGTIITGNIFRLITEYAWKQTTSRPLVFSNNIVLEFNKAAHFIDLGTSGSTNIKDITITGNNIRCSAAGAVAVHIDAFTGSASNIAIVGNVFRGPGSGTAVLISVAIDGVAILNGYRGWDTDVGGPGAVGTGGDHGLLEGLADDDHTQYVLDAILTAKGSIFAATAASTPAERTVGADDTILMADSAQATGIKWATGAEVSAVVVLDHGALTGLADDDHTQYVLDAILTAKGSLFAATAASTPAELAIGADDTLLMAASAQATGIRWGTPAQVSAVLDHDALLNFVANEHLLPAAIDHDALLNFVAGEHQLEAAINHDALLNFVANEHLLPAAIDHDGLLNFVANEHLLPAAIDHGALSGLGDDDHAVYALHAGDTYTGVHDFGGATSFEIPNSATPTEPNVAGEIVLDTTVTDWKGGQLRIWGAQELMLIPMIATNHVTVTDGHIIAYNAANDEFEMVAGGGGGGHGSATVDGHGDVDTTTSVPTLNEVLKWDGTNWVPGLAGDTSEFTFSIDSFSDGISDINQLIGAGEWKAIGVISFTATYSNAPGGMTAEVALSGAGNSWGSNEVMTPVTGPETNDVKVDYPASPGDTITFTLSQSADASTAIETVTFNNTMRYGSNANGQGAQTEANLEALTEVAGPSESRSQTINNIVTPTGGHFLTFAYADRLGDVAQVQVNKDSQGYVTASFAAAATTLAPDIQTGITNVANSAGYSETFAAITSRLADLPDGSDDWKLLTSGLALNYIYWGELAKASSYTEADVETNIATQPGRVASNSMSSRSMTVNAGVTEHTYIAYPARLGALTSIIIGGFESIGDFNVDNTALAITNHGGYQENYRVYVSVNPGFTDPTTMLVTI